MKNNKGFSLVELIVVIAIMAILAAVAIPTFATFIARANEASDIDFMNNVEYAAELAYAGEALKVTAIEVELTEDKGNAEKVTVTFAINDGTDTLVVQKNNSSSDAKEKELMDLIAGTIDWEYDFKTKETTLEASTKWKKNANTDGVVWTLTIPSAGGENP